MDTKNQEKNTQSLNELRERAMKVTEALYRTTDLFSDAEPLKWSLRDSAVKILNIISDISAHPTYQELRSAQSLGKMIEAICYKLDLATGGTFIARANFDVLEREYKSLSDKISNADFFSESLLSSNIMDISDNRTLVVQKSPIELKMSDVAQRPQTKIFTETISEHTKSFSSDEIDNKQNASSVLSDRKGTILRIIKERGPSSVGDLARLVDVSLSEKTIQRDLNAMAEAGVLKRDGEKRWRRYFL